MKANTQRNVQLWRFAAAVYLLLLLWGILFKFSFVELIERSHPDTLALRFWDGFDFFPYLRVPSVPYVTYNLSVLCLNVLLFIPHGIYAARLLGSVGGALCGALTSVLVEALQLLCGFGVFALEDIAANTLGVLLGVLIYRFFVPRLRKRTVDAVNRAVAGFGAAVAVGALCTLIDAMLIYRIP